MISLGIRWSATDHSVGQDMLEGHTEGRFSSERGVSGICKDLMPIHGMISCKMQGFMSSGAL